MFRDKSLSIKTLLVTWAVTSIFTVIFTALQISIEYTKEKKDLLNTYRIINDIYTKPLSESLWVMNKEIITSQGSSLAGFPYVSYVKIFDEQSTYYESGVKSDYSKEYILLHRDESIGNLVVGLNKKQLEVKFLKRVMVTVLLQGVKALVVCIILFFAYEVLITRSLRQVSQFLIQNPDILNKGKKIPFDEDRDDEFGVLVKNLNNFISYIYGLNKSHNDLLNDLEDKVEQRTSELKSKNDQLVNAIEDLEKAHVQLATNEKLASLGKMTAGIAHEIKNPIYIIVNSVSLIKELIAELMEDIPEDVKENIDPETLQNINELCVKSERSCDRVGNIINSMLSLSRGASDKKEHADVSNIVKAAVDFSYEAFKSKNRFNSKIIFDLDREGVSLDVYKVDLSRAIINISDNAYYSMLKRKEEDTNFTPVLHVSVKRLKNEIIIKIMDNGIGISPEIKENIFDPFYTTKPTGEGTGLGMSMTYDIVKRHSGALMIESSKNEGATVSISLPA